MDLCKQRLVQAGCRNLPLAYRGHSLTFFRLQMLKKPIQKLFYWVGK